MKNFRHSDALIRSCCIRDRVRAMLHNHRRLAGALLLSIGVAAYANSSGETTAREAEADRCDNPGQTLKETVHISAGGPYVAKAGVPITLHGKYSVAGQTDNSDQLKIIGQALHSYLHDHGTYPPAALLNADGRRTVSWRVLILPYLGEKALYDRFDLDKPWDDPVNLCLLREMPDVYRKSGADADTTDTGFAGVEGSESLFQNASAQLNGGRELSGITQTEKIAAGPVGADVHLPWTAPGDIDIEKAIQLSSAHGFSGEGHAFTPLLFLDGTVHLVPDSVAAGPMTMWTHVSGSTAQNRCPCAPPSSVDAGLRAIWDLGKNGTFNTAGSDVTFLAREPGTYTVTLHVFDRFGGEYNSSTKVEVHQQ